MTERLSPHLTSLFCMEIVKIANLKSSLHEEEKYFFSIALILCLYEMMTVIKLIVVIIS